MKLFLKLVIISIILIIGYSQGYVNCTQDTARVPCPSGCCSSDAFSVLTCQASNTNCMPVINTNTTTTNTTNDNTDIQSSPVTLSAGAIVGISIGSFVFYVIAIFIIVCVVRKCRKQQQQQETKKIIPQPISQDFFKTNQNIVPKYPPQYTNQQDLSMSMGIQLPYQSNTPLKKQY